MSNRAKVTLNIILNIVLVCTVIITAYIVFFAFAFFATHVEGVSMQPTYNANGGQDRILASKIVNYTYGDVVIIETNEEDLVNGGNKHIIKRVIALAGDSVNMAFQEGRLQIFVNGVQIEEKQYSEPIEYPIIPNTFLHFEALKTTWSYDSNENGLLIPEGMVFVLGDNRDDSLDSATYGPYLAEKVVARVLKTIDENSIPQFELIKYLFGK